MYAVLGHAVPSPASPGSSWQIWHLNLDVLRIHAVSTLAQASVMRGTGESRGLPSGSGDAPPALHH